MPDNNRLIILDTPAHIAAYQALARYHALKLEVKFPGMRHSRGSVMNLIKREYLPDSKARTKKAVLAEYETLLTECGILTPCAGV
jgi:hypothetical protein